MRFRSMVALGVAAVAGLVLAGAPAQADDGAGEPPLTLTQSAPLQARAAAVVSPLALTQQNFSGDFKASVRTTTFSTFTNNTISVTVTPTNCTPGYGRIYVRLYNVTILTNSWEVTPSKLVNCNQTTQVSWSAPGRGAFQVQFDRTGPSGTDENTKHVSGYISYNS